MSHYPCKLHFSYLEYLDFCFLKRMNRLIITDIIYKTIISILIII